MIFDPSPFLPCNTPCPLPGGPELLPRPHGHLPFEGWAWGASLGWGGAFDHYLQVSLGDGLFLHSELQVLHLPAGGEGAE